MKKIIEEGGKLVKQYGYWSNEVYNFNNSILNKFTAEKYEKIQGEIKRV